MATAGSGRSVPAEADQIVSAFSPDCVRPLGAFWCGMRAMTWPEYRAFAWKVFKFTMEPNSAAKVALAFVTVFKLAAMQDKTALGWATFRSKGVRPLPKTCLHLRQALLSSQHMFSLMGHG